MSTPYRMVDQNLIERKQSNSSALSLSPLNYYWSYLNNWPTFSRQCDEEKPTNSVLFQNSNLIQTVGNSWRDNISNSLPYLTLSSPLCLVPFVLPPCEFWKILVLEIFLQNILCKKIPSLLLQTRIPIFFYLSTMP